jgi:hypothetical protein
MPSLAFVALLGAIGLLALLPTRRLHVGGWKNPALTTYFLILVALGLLVAELRGPARYLIPILVVIYVAPFVITRDGIARVRGRMGGGPTIIDPGRQRRSTRSEPKNVTPKEAQPPDAR